MPPTPTDVDRIDMPRPDIPAHLTASPDEPIGCHLIEGTLFGTGYGFSAAEMVQQVDARGGLDRVVVEHADSDHYGALPQLVDRFDPEIVVPHEDQGFLPRAYYGIEADRLLEDGDEVAGFRAISIPGHTPGNASFADEDAGILVAGDSVVRSDSDIAAEGEWSGALAPVADVFNRDTAASRSNLDALAGIDVEAVLLTHGADLTSGGTAAIDALLGDLGLD